MTKKLSPLWVRGPSSRTQHRKREYSKTGGRTLCGIHVGPGWWHITRELPSKLHKCKRCAA